MHFTPKPHWKLLMVCHRCASWMLSQYYYDCSQVVLQPSFLLSSQVLLCSCAHLWATDQSSCAKKYPVALSVHVTIQTRAADGSTCARVTRDKEIFFLPSSSAFSKRPLSRVQPPQHNMAWSTWFPSNNFYSQAILVDQTTPQLWWKPYTVYY